MKKKSKQRLKHFLAHTQLIDGIQSERIDLLEMRMNCALKRIEELELRLGYMLKRSEEELDRLGAPQSEYQ